MKRRHDTRCRDTGTPTLIGLPSGVKDRDAFCDIVTGEGSVSWVDLTLEDDSLKMSTMYRSEWDYHHNDERPWVTLVKLSAVKDSRLG